MIYSGFLAGLIAELVDARSCSNVLRAATIAVWEKDVRSNNWKRHQIFTAYKKYAMQSYFIMRQHQVKIELAEQSFFVREMLSMEQGPFASFDTDVVHLQAHIGPHYV